MLNINELGARIIFSFGDGKLFITESTLFGILIAAFLAILGIWLGSRLENVPRGKQVFAEFIVDGFISSQKNIWEKLILTLLHI